MRRPHWTARASTPARLLTRNARAAAMTAAAVVLLTGAGSATAQAQAPAHPVDPGIVNGTEQQQLNAARQRWQAAHIGDYHFTVERLCFCPPSFRGPATITVRNGAPLAPPAEFTEVATVPRLHTVIQKAINDRVERLDVTYDTRGVPLSISIDVSSMIADEETAYRITAFTVDRPAYSAGGDVRLQLHWEGPRGNATRTLVCRDGVLRSDWPDPTVCTRVLSTPALAKPITIETKDLRITADPKLFSVAGHIEGRLVQFTWPGQGSGTRLTRLREWETALGPDAIAQVRGS
jgi:hypothetical protein